MSEGESETEGAARARRRRRQSHNVYVENPGFIERIRSFFQPSKLLGLWEAVVAASVIPSVFLVVLQAGFDAGSIWQWIFIYLCDALYLVAMVARFLTGHVKRGVLVTDRKSVVLHYLKRTFSADLASIIPLELFAFAATGTQAETLALAAFLRLNRCIRCYRVWIFITTRENQLGTNTNLLTTMKSVFLASLSIHIMACCWFAVSCENQVSYTPSGVKPLCERGSWAHSKYNLDDSAVYKRYILSLYWAVTTITTVGYGDILPKTSLEKWVSVVSMLWGVVLFGYILGGLASTLTTSDAQRARYIHRLNVIRDHLEEAGVSNKVKKKVINFYEYIWQRNRGNPGVDLFKELPVAFRAELSLETYKKVIEKSDLFRDAPEEFMRMLSLVAEQQLYLPRQVIINKGDIGQHMYIITRGEAEVVSGEGEVVAVMKEGSLFGEVNLVHDVPCGGTVRAKTHCDLLLLSKKNIIEITQHFPEMSVKMKEEIQKRCNKAFSRTTLGGNEDEDEMGGGGEGGRRNSARSRQKNNSATAQPSLCQRLTKWWDAHPVLPGTKFSVAWDLILASTIILICLIYPYEAGFSLYHHNVAYASSVGGWALFGLTYPLDLILVVDIIVSMKTAVRTPTGILTRSKTILKHYVCSIYFLLDVAAVVPLEILALSWDTPDKYGYVAIFRLNRLIKIWKVISFFVQMEGSLYISVVYARFLKFTFYIVASTHFSACIWFPLACYSKEKCSGYSWVAAHVASTGSSLTALHDYILSLYWASATLTSVGYGDVSACNPREMVFALVIQLTGIMLYGYCLGVIAATLTNAASFRISFEEKMQVVHGFMFENNLGKGLLQRVDHYFTLLWQQFRGETVPGGQDLMHDMPITVRQDVSMDECAKLLSNARFFQHVDVSFLRHLSTSTSTFLFAAGDIILYSGDMGREMYFISKGYVEVLSEDLSQVVTVQGPGGLFGELGLLFGIPRTLTVRAATNCKLVMLENHALQSILPSYPLIYKEFQKLYEDKEHMEIANKAAYDASRLAMGNLRRFSRPSVLSALVTAMAPSLSIVIRTPMTSTIATCVGSKYIQSLVSCPCSVGKPVNESFVKFNRKEMQDALRSDAETGSQCESGVSRQTLRQRRRRGKVPKVGPSPSDIASRQTVEEEEEEKRGSSGRRRVRRNHIGVIENSFSYLLLPYTMNPNTRVSQVWEVISVIMSLVSVLTVSTQAAFLHDESWLWAICYFMEIFFLTDMIVKLHTAFYNKEGILVTHPLECAKHYFKTNFFVDLLSCFPTDLLVLASWTRNIKDVLRVLSMSRLNRLLRVYKLPLAFKYLEGQIGRDVGTITEVKLALYMVVATHLMACGWFIVACSSFTAAAGDPHTCGLNSWAMKTSMLDGSSNHLSNYSIAYQYLVSLYWATATSTTVGYGDISAHNDTERVYAVLVMVLGVLAYGYIIASVAASLANADSGRAQYQEKLEGIKSFMRDQSLESTLQKRVINYYEYNWQRNKGVSFGSLFQGMPISLQADISLSLYKGIIDQVPLFQNTEIGFTKLLALAIQPRLFLSKEYIVKKGDIGSQMFFINRGVVEVVSEDGSVVFATMTEGKFFGEISLVFSCPRTASIRAATNSDVFVLTKADLDRALSYYPEIAEQINEVAGNRANLVKKRSQIAAKAAAEGKSAADAAKAAAQGTKDETDKDEEEEPAATTGTHLQPTTSSQDTTHAEEEDEGEKKQEEEEEEDQKKTEDQEVVVVEEMVIEEECEPPRPSLLKRTMTSFRKKIAILFVFTINRERRVGLFLRVLGSVLAFLSCFTITYQAAFQNNKYQLWVANYVFEAYFIIEIFIKFHLTYKDSNGEPVTDLKSIALHYIKDPMGFAFDLLAVFPFEVLAAPVSNPVTRTSAVLYLRLPHIIRGIRIQSFMSEEEKKLNQRTLLLRMIKFTVLISICTHFVACLWYILGCQAGTCRSGTWANKAKLVNTGAQDADHYLNSLYWSMATMTTTGYGDLSATNVQEMLYAIAVMVAGKLIFGFILGSIASTLANMDTQRVLFEEKLNALKVYMKQQKLSSPVQGRVINFFDYLWIRNKGTHPHTLLADMPYCMQSEVSLATTETLIKQMPLFASMSNAFLRHLTLSIRPSMFLPGDFIVHKGDVGLGAFFLYRGKAEILNKDLSVRELLREGDHFGDRSLVYNTPMQWSVVAVTHVDVFSISQRDFEAVLQDHSESRDVINTLAEQLYGQTIPGAHD